jgi:intracellular septation protein A
MHNRSKKIKKPISEGGLWSLFLNFLIPSFILIKGCSQWGFTPVVALLLALIFPLLFGVYRFLTAEQFSLLAALGIISVLLTGGIGLFNLPKEWMPFKEASISTLLGCYLISMAHTKNNPIRMLLKRVEFIDMPRIQSALDRNQAQAHWNKLLQRCTYLIGSSFFISAFLHFYITRSLLKNETGTAAFVEQLGRVHLWSGLIIAVPCLIISSATLYYFFTALKNLTGLNADAILLDQTK